MIVIKGLDKSFEHVHALSNINMHINKGSIYGLVGTNGSGKTTLLKHIAGIIRPDKGEISINGMPLSDDDVLKDKVFFIPDELFFYGNYTIEDMCRLYRGLYSDWNQDRFDNLVNVLELKKGIKISRFSKGVQKQVIFSLGMSTMPDVLLLDEPVDGLDPIVRRVVWDLIVDDVAERNMTVLISSHNLREIESICDTVGILSKGELVLQRDLDDLRSNVHKIQVAFSEKPENPYLELDILSQTKSGSIDILIARNSAKEIEDVLGRSKPLILDLMPLTLEEIFIYELGGDSNEHKEIIG